MAGSEEQGESVVIDETYFKGSHEEGLSGNCSVFRKPWRDPVHSIPEGDCVGTEMQYTHGSEARRYGRLDKVVGGNGNTVGERNGSEERVGI